MSGLPSIPVFYDPRMIAEGADTFSPSAHKPREVVASWQRRHFPVELLPVTPVTTAQLKRVHHPFYVDEILACRRNNGFGNKLPGVAASLPWTSGAMLSAARHVLATGTVACAPCSGFHHAHTDHAEGYCTFNGLMVTAVALLDDGSARRVGILDADQHYGNGTAEIIRTLHLEDQVPHVTFGADFQEDWQAPEFLEELPGVVRRFAGCDLLLYQAGADPHVDDPLGGWLTTAQLRERDRRVFRACRDIGLPTAWNLAGGYQRDGRGSIRPVLDIHDNTMIECIDVYLGGA